MTCQMSTTEATGTIIGLRKKVRNMLFPGMRHSSARARMRASTTALGTAMAEKIAVFFAARRKEELCISSWKFLRKTKLGSPVLLMRE